MLRPLYLLRLDFDPFPFQRVLSLEFPHEAGKFEHDWVFAFFQQLRIDIVTCFSGLKLPEFPQ